MRTFLIIFLFACSGCLGAGDLGNRDRADDGGDDDDITPTEADDDDSADRWTCDLDAAVGWWAQDPIAPDGLLIAPSRGDGGGWTAEYSFVAAGYSWTADLNEHDSGPCGWVSNGWTAALFFFKQKTAYEIHR